MKIKLSELNHNPYKIQINEGKLNEEQIEKLSKNLDELGLMGSIPIVQRDKKYFIVNCHHRVEALKRKFGNDFQVEVTLHDYDDSQLLQGMVIENLTQRNNDFREELENVNAVKHFLESKSQCVRTSDTLNIEKGKKGFQDVPGDARSISDFLNDTISKSRVAELLRISKNIPETIILESTNKQGEFKEGQLRYDQLVSLSKLEDTEEINDLANALKISHNQRVLDHRGFIKSYIDAPLEIKKQIRQGTLDIADIEEATIVYTRDNEYEEETLYFTPNFSSQIKAFNKDVIKLEKQVALFNRVFSDKQFKEKYANLKPKDKKLLDSSIFNIHVRIKNCYDRVEQFMEQLPDKILGEGKENEQS